MWPGPSIGSRSAPRSRGVRRRLASISHVYSLAPHSRVSSNGSCRRAHALICRLPAAATSSYFGSEMTFANTATYCKPWLIRESFSWYDSATETPWQKHLGLELSSSRSRRPMATVVMGSRLRRPRAHYCTGTCILYTFWLCWPDVELVV